MPAVTSTPTTVTFNQDDRILYTGSCSLQISFIKEDGGISPVKVLSQDQWFIIPAAGDYQLVTVGACCNDGTYEVFLDASSIANATPTETHRPEQIPACMTNAAGDMIPVTLNTVFDESGDVERTFLTNASGTVILAPAGYTVTAGSCYSSVDYESTSVCDADTGTLWERWYSVENGVVTPLGAWEDTGRSCAEPVVVERDFCAQP